MRLTQRFEREGGEEMSKRYPKLRGLIREIYEVQSCFARAMGMHPATLSKKMAGKVPWTDDEMQLACQLLGVPLDRLHEIFFSD